MFIFIFPLLLYALLGSVYEGEIDGAPAVDVLLAGLFGYGAANTALAGLAIILVGRREAGVLKRLRATPLPPATYMAAVLLSMLVIFALQSAGLVALGLPPSAQPARELARVRGRDPSRRRVLRRPWPRGSLADSISGEESRRSSTSLCCRWRSSRARSARPTKYPALLEAVADVLPLTYFLDIVYGVYLDGDSLFADGKALAVVAAWGVAGLVVALRRFSWMPRER